MLWVIVLLRSFDAKDVLHVNGIHTLVMVILFYVSIFFFEVGFILLLYILAQITHENNAWIIAGGVVIGVGGFLSFVFGINKSFNWGRSKKTKPFNRMSRLKKRNPVPRSETFPNF